MTPEPALRGYLFSMTLLVSCLSALLLAFQALYSLIKNNNWQKNDSALTDFYGKILYIKTLQYAVDFYAFHYRSLLDWAFVRRG